MSTNDAPGSVPVFDNLFHRRPELYDQVHADPDHSGASQVAAAITRVNTMRRRWEFDDGTSSIDNVRRRVIFSAELTMLLPTVGFVDVEFGDHPALGQIRCAVMTGDGAVVRGN